MDVVENILCDFLVSKQRFSMTKKCDVVITRLDLQTEKNVKKTVNVF